MGILKNPNTIIKFFNNIYFVSVFTFLSIIYFFSGIFFGLDFTDTFFHLNLAQIPPDGIMLFPILLSSLIIKGLIEFFGPHLIYLRFINGSLYVIALLIPFFFIKTRSSTIKKVFYIGCVLFLIAPLNANVLGYDSFTILINSLLFTTTLYYLEKEKLYVLVILSFLCSMSILIRLPNALVLPILMFVIFYQQKLHSSKFHLTQIKLPLLFLFLSLLGVFFSYFLYYEEWKVFRNASLGTISHNLELLFYTYFLDGIKLLIFSSFITGSYFLFKKIYDFYGKHLAYGIVILLYVVFIKLFLLRYSYPIFLTALILSIVVIHLYTERGKNKISDILILGVFFSFLFINAIGSNLGLLKTSFLFLLLPFVLSAIPVRSINFWKIILIILIPLAIFLKFHRTYEGQNVFSLNRTLNIELLHPIKTSEKRFVFLDEVNQKVKQLQNENVSVFFYGNKSHIFHYLYPNTTLEIKAIDQPLENLIFFPQIEEKIRDKRKVAVFLIPSYPGSPENIENAVEAKLIKRGFKKSQEGSVNFLLKQED